MSSNVHIAAGRDAQHPASLLQHNLETLSNPFIHLGCIEQLIHVSAEDDGVFCSIELKNSHNHDPESCLN